jgi:hypothetical protein
LSNIEEYRFKEFGGYGKDRGAPARHLIEKNGKTIKRLKDGCKLRDTCEGCEIPVENCEG